MVRLRVILCQPYTKNKQFGLRFIDIIPNNETSQESAKSKTSVIERDVLIMC
jgi:hypothetical protein